MALQLNFQQSHEIVILRYPHTFGHAVYVICGCFYASSLDGEGVEITQHLSGYLEYPLAFPVKQSLPCLFHHLVSMRHPGQALRDMDTITVHALYQGPINIKRGIVSSLLLSKVHYQPLSLFDIEE